MVFIIVLLEMENLLIHYNLNKRNVEENVSISIIYVTFLMNIYT